MQTSAQEATFVEWWNWMIEDPENRLLHMLYHYRLYATLAIGFIILACLVSTGKKSTQSASSAAQVERTQEQDDERLYSKINDLVDYFVDAMNSVGNPDMSNKRPWFYAKHTLVDVRNAKVQLPANLNFNGPAWWIDRSCITRDGEWEYIGSYLTYREGSHDEFSAWWAVSSKYMTSSLREGGPKPFNMYVVYEVHDATLKDAFTRLSQGMEQLLRQHNPSALEEFQHLCGA